MRSWAGWSAAALVAVGCGGGTDAAVSLVSDGPEVPVREAPAPDAHEDLTCASCAVAGAGEAACGTEWALNASPRTGDGAGPGFAGEGVAATGWLRQRDPDGGTHEWPVDTILRCERRADGRTWAVVAGTTPDGERFTADARDLLALGSGTLRAEGLGRCVRACPAGQCMCPRTDVCGGCDESAAGPPVAGGPPPPPEPPGAETSPPPVGSPPPPPPPPFIPL
jgi:hypothetical protein